MERLAEYKESVRTTWATGDYDAMMREEGLYEVGQRLVDALAVQSGEDVLDVGCGTGNAALPAARAGARVTGLDLTPAMLAKARERGAGLGIDWVEGDAEELPFPDESFDVVLSSFGCMFAPRHQVVAGEMARVLRPGGQLGVCAWTPEGTIGEFFRVVGGYLPPAPEYVDTPLAWGSEDAVRALFEGIELSFSRELGMIRHPSVVEAVDCYGTQFGPVVLAREALGPEWPALRDDLVELFERNNTSGSGRLVLPAEYLVIRGQRRASNA
ncbi:class I SAM-dependent methyltransferase [Kribbella jiaozuonensis]|uniref:Methyltransferase domain-containing protein n=1 Tax=Kribbella jiaozuonensis TaxID=2575441 RepID=A0A4U3LYL0_9ACTN|nr:methyltransferase domain-containing protein [Kribbella jiaozuonensis]TKK81338.1 methyltransferase domain-containing protein [Kribbella jiaozuonensis]